MGQSFITGVVTKTADNGTVEKLKNKSQSSQKAKRKQRRPSYTSIRESLERRLYCGSGDEFIADWKEAGTQPTYRFSRHHRPSFIPSYASLSKLELVQPLDKHQCGLPHGLSVDKATTHVPFITLDPDRHNASICPDHFLTLCEAVVEFAQQQTDFFLQGEVNPRNGSAKIFMWHKELEAIPIDDVRDLAEQFKEKIKDLTGNEIEVFPAKGNTKIKLPCREDKISVVDTGLLGRHKERYVKVYDEMVYENPANPIMTHEQVWALIDKKDRPTKRSHYETYDYREWQAFLDRQESMDVDLWLSAIKKGCKNLPHEDLKANIPHSAEPRCGMRSTAKPSNRLSSGPTANEDRFAVVVPKKTAKPKKLRLPPLDELRQEPNSYTRQLQFCLLICQKAKRVVEVDEALDLIREHDMFTDDWFDNELRREHRVGSILNRIARTFDPDMLGSGTTMDIAFDCWMKWGRGKFADQRRVAVSFSSGCVFEDGTVRLASSYQRYCRFSPDEIGFVYAIISYCMRTSLLEDGGVPEDRAEAIWKLFHEAKLPKSKWNVTKFRNIRDMLHDLDIIKCDYIKRPGKAYCYKAGNFNPEQPTWKNSVKRLRTAGTASSYIYKRRELNTVGVYYTSDFRENRLNGLSGTRQRPPP
jgi:hypothetical protein